MYKTSLRPKQIPGTAGLHGISNSIMLSCLSYGFGIWNLRYTEIIERIQVMLFKRLLCFIQTTPDLVVRISELLSFETIYFLVAKASRYG